MRALLVESSRFHRQTIGAILQSAGFKVDYHDTADEILMHASVKTSYSLVCLDLLSNDASNIDACRLLRKLPGYSQIPIVLVTSREDPRLTGEALRSGVTEVFFKSDLVLFKSFVEGLAKQLQDHSTLNGQILYVEDSHTTAHAIMSWIKPLGLEVDHFISGEDALESFRKKDYDLVLTDVLLEGKMNGIGLVREIRNSMHSHIPILVISGFENPSRRLEVFRCGANDFVFHPVMREEFIARLKSLIYNKRLLDDAENQKKQMETLALTDQLTSLYNRHVLHEMAPKSLAEAARHNFPLSVIVLDIDNFKKINDSYGHLIGDNVLVKVGGAIRDFCRTEDFAARIGGEEFVVIMPHCSVENAFLRAEHLREQISQISTSGIGVTASIGVADLASSGVTDFDSIFSLADGAMYTAKTGGKNRVAKALTA